MPSIQQICNTAADKSVSKRGVLYHLGTIYFLFGFTNVIYAMFIVTTLAKERGFPEPTQELLGCSGVSQFFSGPVSGSPSDKLGRNTGLILGFPLQMIAYLLIASELSGTFFTVDRSLRNSCLEHPFHHGRRGGRLCGSGKNG